MPPKGYKHAPGTEGKDAPFVRPDGTPPLAKNKYYKRIPAHLQKKPGPKTRADKIASGELPAHSLLQEKWGHQIKVRSPLEKLEDAITMIREAFAAVQQQEQQRLLRRLADAFAEETYPR